MQNLKTLMRLLGIQLALTAIVFFTILAPVEDIPRNVLLSAIFGGGGGLILIGILLTYLTVKWNIQGKMRKYLLLSGISIASFLPLSIAHNLFYGVAERFSDLAIIYYPAQALEVLAFLASIIGCPILFLIGTVKSYQEYKRLKKASSTTSIDI